MCVCVYVSMHICECLCITYICLNACVCMYVCFAGQHWEQNMPCDISPLFQVSSECIAEPKGLVMYICMYVYMIVMYECMHTCIFMYVICIHVYLCM